MNVQSLRAGVAGSVVAKGEPEYETQRDAMLWNRCVPQQYPELIVRVGTDADVVEAVRFARAERLQVAVRGRGHSMSGAPLRNGTLLIDLSRLDALDIDAHAGTAIVQPAVTGRQLIRALAPHGFVFPAGHCSGVPMSGYLLGGGLGWNQSALGPACASVRAVEVVTADAQRITATESSHADLFWAARGAGPCFFGVATRFHLRLHRTPGAIHTSTYVYPIDWADAVAAWAATLAPELPRDVELTTLLFPAPGTNQRVCILTATAFAESPEQAATTLQPLADSPFIDRCSNVIENEPTPIDALFDTVDPTFPDGYRYLSDTFWLKSSPGDAIAIARDKLVDAPSPRSGVLCLLSGLPPHLPDMACSMHDRALLACYAIWDKAQDDGANQNWLRALGSAMEKHASGHQIAECDLSIPIRVERSFSPDGWRRLNDLRRKYDPDSLFSMPLVSRS
jgi:FAD/FMN-containing dehydrogenase